MSGRQVDLLIGPAGAGKTTAMRALHAAWTVAHGEDTVIGLAPSAAAAQVLAEDLGVECDNTAKWLHEYDRGRTTFGKDQLVIIDEATLAGTLTLDRLTGLAAVAGARTALGPEPTTDAQRLDRARASAAIRRAEAIAREAEDARGHSQGVSVGGPSIR